MNKAGHIVADGRRRIRETPEFKAACLEAVQAVRQEYAVEMEQAGAIRRLMLRARMKREIRIRIEQLASNDAHFLSGE